MIAAVAKNGVIGNHDGLPWYLPADLRHFKQLTVGQTVIVGRTTHESIVTRLGHPLPDRRTIMVTRQMDYVPEGVEVAHSLDEAIAMADGNAVIIGGGEIYRQGLPRADRLEITEVATEPEGDVTFPEIDESWQEIARDRHVHDDKNPYDYDFVSYIRQR
nr:Dihydrofolate reductase [uncultured bacterium]